MANQNLPDGLVSFEEAKRLAITTREQYLERLPKMAEILTEQEKYAGRLHKCNSISFDDERLVMIFKFERFYFLVFFNPQNPAEAKEKNIWLSYEAMRAMALLYSFLADESDSAALHAATQKQAEEETEAAEK